jgi:N-acetylglucosaminyl-diphospho-decaprenol L-rhamnosyltransferase
MQTDIRIQIVNYKTKEYLLVCLESLFKDLEDAKFSYQLVVLDNASGDDLSEISKRFPGKPIEIHQNSKNVGFGAGHNILAKNAQAKYLLFLNPDTKIIEPHSIERLLRRAQDSNAQVVGPRLITENGQAQRYDHGELAGFTAWVALNSGHAYWHERREVSNVAWTCGAVFLIEKTWFERLSGFDENFFLYKEEEELCWRLRAAGGIVVYDPTISFFHHGGVVARKTKYMRDSTSYFLKKHFQGKPSYFILALINHLMHYPDGY